MKLERQVFKSIEKVHRINRINQVSVQRAFSSAKTTWFCNSYINAKVTKVYLPFSTKQGILCSSMNLPWRSFRFSWTGNCSGTFRTHCCRPALNSNTKSFSETFTFSLFLFMFTPLQSVSACSECYTCGLKFSISHSTPTKKYTISTNSIS